MLATFYRITFIALILLAAQPQARADFATLQEITEDMGQYYKSVAYAAYIARENIDPDTVATVLGDVKDWQHNPLKYDAYIAYIAYKDADPDTVTAILDEVQGSKESNKSEIYVAYIA